MQQLSREVIIDLLPAYLSGEVSTETRVLVDAAAAQDPAIAKLIASARGLSFDAEPPSLPRRVEMAAIRRTRSRIRRQLWTLALAIFFSFLPFMFLFRAGQIDLSAFPKQAVVFWAIAVVMWFEHYVLGREEGRSGVFRSLKDAWHKRRQQR